MPQREVDDDVHDVVLDHDVILDDLRDLGAQLLDGLRRSLADVSEICDIRGTGLMLGIEFGNPTANAGSEEAAEAARRFAWDRLALDRLVSYVAPENARSIRVATGLGAIHDGATEDGVLVFRHVRGRA